MKELDELRKSWSNQKPAADMKFDIENKKAASLSMLKKFEKKIFRINAAKTLGIFIGLMLLVYTLLIATPFSAPRAAAVAILVITTANFWKKYLKLQLKTAKLDVKENSLVFIDDVLNNFTAQREFFKKDFLVFGGILIAGLNLIYLDLLTDMQALERIGYHVFMSALLITVLFLGIKFRMRRFKNENEPIEIELIKIKEDLKENANS